MRPSSARMAMIAAALLAITLSSACGNRKNDSATPAALASLHIVASQPLALGLAEVRATQHCLQAHGFDAPQARPVVGSIGNVPLAIQPDAARVNGYGDAIPRSADPADDPVERYAQTLPQAQRDQLHTVLDDRAAERARFNTPNGWSVEASRGGCAAEARVAVYGSVDNWLLAYYLPQDLNDVAANAYTRAPVVAAIADYRLCMASHLYPVDFPQDAVQQAQEASAGLGKPSKRELLIAAADAKCQQISNLQAVVQATIDQDALPWVKRNQELITKAAKVVEQASTRAQTILSDI